MGPPDGPSGPREFEWAHVIESELNSWDPRCLSTRFEPRQRPAAIWRPLPVALAVLIFAVLAATVLAAGPRALGTVISSLTPRPQPSATPVSPHASRVIHLASPSTASGAASGPAAGAPAASAPSSTSQPAPTGTPAGQGQPYGAGRSPGDSQAGAPQVQLPPVPQRTQIPKLPPLPTPALPHIPLPVVPPQPGSGTPTPGHGSGLPPTPGQQPLTHPAPGPTRP
ncbi:MAG: hypothetical protein DLM67_16820, partial [Candidatus Nephthysia bennettiae]